MTGTFTFAVISDTHIRALCGDQSSPYAVNEKANGRARYAVQLVAAEQPDLIIHLGDMVHPLPHMAAYLPASEEAKKIFRPIASGLHFVPAITISATSRRWSRLRARPTRPVLAAMARRLASPIMRSNIRM